MVEIRGSGRLGGYGEPMTGAILSDLARVRALSANKGEASATETERELLRDLSRELRRITPGDQHQDPTLR